MPKRYALFAFNGDPMCFVHVLLNGIDLADKGHEVKIVMEGNATALIPELQKDGDTPSHKLYKIAREKGLIDSACRACSHKMGVLKEVEAQGIPLKDEMSGHPSFSLFLDDGWEVLTF
jgi:hypothetical protein